MKVLFCGLPKPGTNSWMRYDALRRLGHEVEDLNINGQMLWGGRVGGFLLRRFLTGPPLWNLNRGILAAYRASRPDLVWIEKGLFVTPETLTVLKEGGARLVHYTGDPSFQYYRSRHFFRCAPLYDVAAHIKTWEVEEYRRRGYKGLYVDPAYDPRLHHPGPWRSGKEDGSWDVVFIGRWEREREEDLRAIQALGVRLAVWGPRFLEHCRDRKLMEECFKGSWIGGEDYARALGQSRITLCFLARVYPDQITYRTFEIPACGGFMLAQRTQEQRRFFEEDREASYFSSQGEMLGKIRHYLGRDGERSRVAAAGLARCRAASNTHEDRVSRILAVAMGEAPWN